MHGARVCLLQAGHLRSLSILVAVRRFRHAACSCLPRVLGRIRTSAPPPPPPPPPLALLQPRPLFDGALTRVISCELQYGPMNCDFAYRGTNAPVFDEITLPPVSRLLFRPPVPTRLLIA